MPCHSLRYIHFDELDDYLLGRDNFVHDLPPDGMSIDWPADGPPLDRLPDICGVPTTIHPGRKHYATLGELLYGNVSDVLEWAARLASGGDPAVVAVTGALDLPVVWDEGATMRWIRSTHRGTLYTTEQFQFKLDWGIPGADPTLGESEAGAFAQFLRDAWAANWIATFGTSSLGGLCSSDVKFTEVGVVSWTQTSAKNADGSGGDSAQDYPTAWSAYDVGTLPTGSAGSNCLPFETSCALTFQTNKRGPRGRGRAYLPPFSVSGLDAHGLYNTAAVAAAGGAVGGLFDDVKGSTYAYLPVVVSQREVTLHEIVAINVGLVPDSQRRRRRSQSEGYTAAWTSA